MLRSAFVFGLTECQDIRLIDVASPKDLPHADDGMGDTRSENAAGHIDEENPILKDPMSNHLMQTIRCDVFTIRR